MVPLLVQTHSAWHQVLAMVSDHKTYFWPVGLDSTPSWIPSTLTYIWLGVIVIYLGIPFVVDLPSVSMWVGLVYSVTPKETSCLAA